MGSVGAKLIRLGAMQGDHFDRGLAAGKTASLELLRAGQPVRLPHARMRVKERDALLETEVAKPTVARLRGWCAAGFTGADGTLKVDADDAVRFPEFAEALDRFNHGFERGWLCYAVAEGMETAGSA